MKYFETEFRVRDYELDAQGIVNNANYLHYFEATRHEMMESCGLTFRELTEQEIYPVIRNANIAYRESLRGSDRFLSRVAVQKDGIKYFFLQWIYRLPDMRLCCKATIESVCVVGGKASEPEAFDRAFKDYL